ncbi:hypothetical protein LAZ67_19002595 [Cordylochernes scorpioides]|uniref:Uncharacterized protein n=1 Tax=Cordylochernes scorpioides TaxID=51811 RepID=A0ABY6LJL3_9ARAC|nr:hypothetical protein LAZ67_19002595 [Cordylochernes scorpioides]
MRIGPEKFRHLRIVFNVGLGQAIEDPVIAWRRTIAVGKNTWLIFFITVNISNLNVGRLPKLTKFQETQPHHIRPFIIGRMNLNMTENQHKMNHVQDWPIDLTTFQKWYQKSILHRYGRSTSEDIWVSRLLRSTKNANGQTFLSSVYRLISLNSLEFQRRFVTQSKQWTCLGKKASKKAKTDALARHLLSKFKTILKASNVTAAKLLELGFQLVPHIPYFSDLAPCDIFYFPNLKQWLGGRKFSSFFAWLFSVGLHPEAVKLTSVAKATIYKYHLGLEVGNTSHHIDLPTLWERTLAVHR